MDKKFIDEVKNYIEIAKETIKPSTFIQYNRYQEKYIQSYFKNIKSSDINTEIIQDFLDYLSKEKVPKSTINSVNALIKSVLNKREKLKQVEIDSNFESKLHILTSLEQDRLEKVAEKEGYPDNLIIGMALYLGLKIGEICGLKWTDIDFENKTLSVSRNVQRMTTSKEGTKTSIIITELSPVNSRIIHLPIFLEKMLRDCITESEFILNSKDKSLEPRVVQRIFKKLLQKSNINDVNFNTLRDTFCVRAIENGFNALTISKILGHSNTAIISSRYKDFLQQDSDKLLEKLAKNKH